MPSAVFGTNALLVVAGSTPPSWFPRHSLSASTLRALLWVLLGTLGVSVSLDTNSASMPHMCELGFETPGDKV